jgi:hypothetical protein
MNNGHEGSHDESPDMDEGVGSPLAGNAPKRGSGSGSSKTKRNARQQDQNKQVWE